MKALVADANAGRRAALDAELARHGYAIAHAATAAETLARVAGEAPVLVLVAARVGEDEGLEICRALRLEPGAGDRIVVLVGAPGDLDALDALDAGAVDVWPVPEGGAGDLSLRVRLAEHYARLQAEHVRLGGEFALLRQALDRTGTVGVQVDVSALRERERLFARERGARAQAEASERGSAFRGSSWPPASVPRGTAASSAGTSTTSSRTREASTSWWAT